MAHIVIIGNGIAGITTARHIRKRSDHHITVISAETDHFFSRTALMYIYMGHMTYEHTKPYEDHFWSKNRIDLLRAYVNAIDIEKKALSLGDGRTISYDKLVLATGSQSNKFGWPGQDLPGVQGLYSYQDLELLEENTENIQRAVIVGGGLIGIELAEMLATRDIPVTFLIREEWYWDNILPIEEAKLVTRHVYEHGIDLRRSTNLVEILAGDDGRVRGITTDQGEEISCQLVGLTPGVHPNIDLVKDSPVETGRGVLVNDYLETNVPDIYACGDCAEIIVEGEARNRIEQLWYTGRMQGQALGRTICGERTFYERGLWFNSAKFMDIEYQTYGFVPNRPREGDAQFYWEDEGHRHCLKIIYNQSDKVVTGMNVFGIRMSQDVWHRWLKEKRDINFVMTHLPEANFDPEFYKAFEGEIIEAFNRQAGTNLQPSRQPGFFQRLFA